MPRPLLALVLLAGGLVLTAQQALTGSNSLPATSTAVHRATTVSGATPVSIDHTIVGGKITTVTARLQKVDLLGTTVTARFGSGSSVSCVAGLISIIDLVTNLGQSDYTCTGFNERADKPRRLTITAS